MSDDVQVMTTPAAGRSRVLDALRLIAIFQMVQGHTIDAVLATSHRVGLLHGAWQSARGLTSVAFLFLAGVGYAFATRTEAGRAAEARARRAQRGLRLIAIGYAMRAPVLVWIGVSVANPPRALAQAWVVDVLQCIGVALLMLDGLSLVLRDAALRKRVLIALALGLYALAPLCAPLDASGPLRPLLMFVTSSGGSLFPLVPWAGHALLGAALGPMFFEREGLARRLATLGAAAFAIGSALALWAHPLLGQVARIGAVLLVAACLVRVEPLLARLPAWSLRVAQQSLLIYLVHVVLAYGSGFGLRDAVGLTLGGFASVLVAAAMLGLCAGLALLYDGLSRSRTALAARTAPG